MSTVEDTNGQPVEQAPKHIHEHEVVEDKTGQTGEWAERLEDHPNQGTKGKTSRRTGGRNECSSTWRDSIVGDRPRRQTADSVEFDGNVGAESPCGESVPELVHEYRHEQHPNPRQHKSNLAGGEPEEGGNQQEGRSNRHRNSEQGKSQTDPMMPQPGNQLHNLLPGMVAAMPYESLRSAIAADMPRLKQVLSDLIRIPSVSAPGFDRGEARRAAEHIVGLLNEAGFTNTQLLEAEAGNPAVFAEMPGPEGAPTVLLYAHYDVQPPGPLEAWKTGPFEPFESEGRIYGRGSSDDKAGVVMHLGAVAAHGDDLPVGIQIFFEGEEEAGSLSLAGLLERNRDLLHPDAIVIGDGGNWDVGVPALLTSLRGLAAVTIELKTLQAAVHSGQYGGVYPDALTAMARLLASLHDDDGSVAIEGMVREDAETGLDIPADLGRKLAGALDGVEEIGTGSIPSRLWAQPTVSTLAIDAPPVDGAINQLVPSARAKVSMRIAPGEDAAEALEKLKAHLVQHTPWGAQLEFLHSESGEAKVIETDNDVVRVWEKAFFEAFGTEAVHMGAGGSIPFIATFSEMFPDAPIVVSGCGDPTSSIHAPNESQDVSDIERSTLAEAIAFSMLAELG